MGKRDSLILEALGETGRMDVAELAERVGVSQVTLRKDLDSLESRSLVRREHGQALLFSPNDVAGRLALGYDVKLRIARAACEMVRDGDTVMVENGSCCALLARELFQARKDVCMVTNSAFIANYVRELPGAKVVLLGGEYQLESQVTVGPMILDFAREFHVRLLFVGTDGWDERGGFTNSDHLRARAVRDMAASAQTTVVLTDSGKFSTQGVVSLGLAPGATVVVTDNGIPKQAQSTLEAAGTRVIAV